MPLAVIGNFFIYCITNAFTPGPGNLLAMNTATNYGVKRGLPLYLGIFTGYFIVETLCATFVYCLAAYIPQVLGIMKYIGAAYILVLAVHIAVSKPKQSTEDSRRPASFFKGFAMQLVNVKIYLFGITALTGYITEYSTAFWVLLLFEAIIAALGCAATMTWVGVGALLQKIYLKYYRIINIILALALLWCAVSILIQ